MFVAFVAQNETKISLFLCANSLLFCRHKLHEFSPNSHQDFALDTALLNIYLNDQSIKKTFGPLTSIHCQLISSILLCCV